MRTQRGKVAADAVPIASDSSRALVSTPPSERARAERLLDALPTAVLLFTDPGLAYANPAARAMFGLADTAGKNPLEVLGVPGLVDALTEASQSQRTVEVEVERDERHLRARASVIAAGEVALAVTDLTETRRVEAMRRDFVTNASHELKTPVAGIQALSESLEFALDRDPARARGMIRRLHQEALRLSNLVRELLDLARLEESIGAERRRQVDLGTMARRQAAQVEAIAAERGITLHVDAEPDIGIVGLPQDLRLIVRNLLDNAVRYNRDGGQVRVALRRSAGSVVLEVTDTGPGIPEAHQARIFERFYRVDEGRSREAGGTGLGLSLVRNAAQRHHGSVEVRSELGAGSTFRVILPEARSS